MQGEVPKDKNMKWRGIKLVSRCSFGCRHEESMSQVFWECPINVSRWMLLHDIFDTGMGTLDMRTLRCKRRQWITFVAYSWDGAVMGLISDI